jgi:hypothetical protein
MTWRNGLNRPRCIESRRAQAENVYVAGLARM